MIVLEIKNVIPAESGKWFALYRQKEAPYYFKQEVDFWLVAKALNTESLRKYPRILNKYLEEPLDEFESKIVEAKSDWGVHAAIVCDCGNAGDLNICSDDGNFERIISSDVTDADLIKEFSKPKSED
jgi:hypothetical protein